MVKIAVGDPLRLTPSDAMGADQTLDASEVDPSLLFHNRYGSPVVGSMKGWGSMEPPEEGWQTRGPEEVSM